MGDKISLDDSASNIGSRHSQRSAKCSTTSSAKLKAAVKMSSVLARVKAMKERHAIEEEEEKLRKRKEMLALETELASSDLQMEMYNAKLKSSLQIEPNGHGQLNMKLKFKLN
ncbi:hypothetical protein GOODEAATRI_029319 [Goodea atripinnis]|uniref:Uncharacterized protein n=1 Tax=Goodea atripinnis TaxID=208336 RepID=A0ABV0PI64_9TELE